MGILHHKCLDDTPIINKYHKKQSKGQQSELKCKIQRSIVYDYLKTISEYNSIYC